MDDTRPITAIRLEELLSDRGITQGDLAKKLGVTQAAISDIITGKTRRSRLIPHIAERFSIELGWLLGTQDHRNGEPPATQSADRAEDRRLAYRGPENEPEPDTVEIDQIDLRFGMGGTFLDEPVNASKRRFSRTWLRHITDTPPELLTWTSGQGDSMYPTIHDRDLVLIDRSETRVQMGDQLWAGFYGDVGIIKRLRPMPDGSVKMISDNQNVPAETAYDGELHLVGRVIAIVRKV